MTLFFICMFIYNGYFKYRYFKVVKATMRRWACKAGNIITYRIDLKTKRSSNELIFEEVLFRDKRFKISLLSENKKVISRFTEEQVLTLEITGEKSNEPAPENSGKDSDVAIISYLINNKRKFLRIKNFEESKTAFQLGL